MKNIIITISFLGILAAGSAQDRTTVQRLPKSDLIIRVGTTSGAKFDFSGISTAIAGPNDQLTAELKLGSFNLDLIRRHYISDQLAKRFGLGLSSINYKLETTRVYPSTERDELEASIKQTRINLMAGIERHFRVNRMGLFTGIGLPVSIIGKTKLHSKTVNTYVSPPSTDVTESEYDVSGGFGIGLQSFAGFNFMISDRFTAGTEISYGLGFSSAGGKTTVTTTENGTTTTSPGSTLKISGLKTQGLNGALSLSFSFY